MSARTIFRHYENHDRLISATVKDMFEACGRGPVEGVPRSTDDLDGWLEAMAVTIHTETPRSSAGPFGTFTPPVTGHLGHWPRFPNLGARRACGE